MRDLLIPIQAFDIIGTGSGTSQSERAFHVVEIGNIKFSICASGCEKVGVFGVELERLDGSRVLGCSRDHGVTWFGYHKSAQLTFILQTQDNPTNLAPLSSLSASHRSNEPFSRAPAITPRELSSDSVHARSLKLDECPVSPSQLLSKV